MAMIGVRELRQRTTEILRQVREEKAEYIITYQGKPVALLLPINTEAVESAMLEASRQSALNGWEAYLRMADAIRKEWPDGISTQEIIDQIRR